MLSGCYRQKIATRKWEQRLRLLNPKKQPTALEHVAAFDLPQAAKMLHRMIAQLNVFPLLPGGQYWLEVSVREIGAAEWMEGGQYPIGIAYAAAV